MVGEFCHIGGMRTSEIADLIVEAADRIILPRFRALGTGEVQEKTPGDFVTIADQEAERFLTERLLAAHPDSCVLGEEATAADPKVRERYAAAAHGWVMDPIDGTRNFINGTPDFAVMLVETHGGDISRTWIWQPIHGRMYTAERGQGATCNGKPLAPRPATRPYDGFADGWAVGTTAGGTVAPVPLRTMCAGVDYPDVAAGRRDFIISTMGEDWDHLPGLGLLAEVGGVLRTDTGDQYRVGTPYRYLIGARTPELWALLHRGMNSENADWPADGRKPYSCAVSEDRAQPDRAP